MDIYNLNYKKEHLGSLDSLCSIEKELIIFKNKTGVVIDEYGTTRLYLDHVKILVSLINADNEWKKIFTKAIEEGHGLLVEGD